MRQKLISARFRHLNETLYTEPSAKAESLFQQNPEMFQDYHAGFRQQVSVWPENPLDKFIIAIQQRGKIRPVPQSKPGRRNGPTQFKKPSKDPANALPRTDGIAVIADLGCGDARLASTLTASGDTKRLNLKLHSFDLHGTPPYVTKADIAHIPLKDGSVDVAILCLSLMGTNWLSFIEEAHRILHWKGELWVAEIKSRFGRGSRAGKPVEHSVGGKRKQAEARKVQEIKSKEQEEAHEQEVLQAQVDGVTVTKDETDVSAFVQVLKRRGFIVKPPPETHIDLNNKMFVKMEFVKALTPVKGKGKPEGNDRAGGQGKTKFFTDEDLEADSEDEAKVLKPCLYKVR
ncbi:methyltransferase-domain-containing protein [Neohortaea acidophila]|uniref:Ribosomal RNA-processing protein 8 n=1 Tax=Neohortaea acidophila TaxID=245834 RepID=A0A6A6PZZ5_9PEZI|nr:methyltransferase-domain-containing protein [Neohortaea acidophila]KAF2485309.1 methyltransferase-domain-containing protein [Neohortaea acidophila]